MVCADRGRDVQVMHPLRVLLVDDSAAFLASASSFLAGFGHVRVSGVAGSGAEGVELAKRLDLDLVLMDLAMPGMSGLAATALIKALPSAPRVVVVSMYDNAEYRRAATEAGADGFVCKDNFAAGVAVLIRSSSTGPAAPAAGTGAP